MRRTSLSFLSSRLECLSEWPCHYPELPCMTQISHCAWEQHPVYLVWLCPWQQLEETHLAKIWVLMWELARLCVPRVLCAVNWHSRWFTSHPLGGMQRETRLDNTLGDVRTCAASKRPTWLVIFGHAAISKTDSSPQHNQRTSSLFVFLPPYRRFWQLSGEKGPLNYQVRL